ncbi:hypothetical protein EN858_17615 [Mesorhizobium sp. M4B.F.Ca.ET.215.01.1.1]|uniref:hypothetical protein n=1 Tax=unclassified Mesorhizobium TaxID=325217 RepID=UPI000FCA8881|nr:MULTISPECIES: hypothetical protein [unclassified Mesorhizobium]RUW72014.1 hypothetical protein EOA31_16590 [Mesorhizobium sp. M4B.F.Ca.ET.049.02.1.2]RVC78396.1 hypothetical protein EN745_19075 [Mesorhizobium sp. M4A.F.Ca.ET.022.05.2.1]TGQ10225.1 hypothetical protein EN858_17615 [Mesorhizobium sp. M4B.F.Ca.ET.215.01.1.1]TGQ34063.1 hypothetical protein EN863_033785 [Mesorhizobium sp. M00.F.Ca.ET.220.01.1.1]TGR02764.1 hypothetical protein EN846_17065 [Mesorhizobium sp. M4B.F.Ca.ET.203.01.1.1]
MNDDVTVEQERAFDDWCELATRAAETKALVDAVASGRAFARFHYLFIESERGANISPLRSESAA